MRRARGMSMLEVIVSLVLVSIIGISLYGWVNSNLLSLSKIDAVLERAQTVPDVLAMLQNINPAEQPQGSFFLDSREVNWRSELIEPVRDMVNGSTGLGLYRMGLYRMNVKISSDEGKLLHQMQLTAVGHQRVRDPVRPF
ncbi:MAG: type II secretion system GspH family protein [Gammaproteobacteria bacterium]|nr:type II secretion system GspH family protein [Gammaproteobacteria bacterium]